MFFHYLVDSQWQSLQPVSTQGHAPPAQWQPPQQMSIQGHVPPAQWQPPQQVSIQGRVPPAQTPTVQVNETVIINRSYDRVRVDVIF